MGEARQLVALDVVWGSGEGGDPLPSQEYKHVGKVRECVE